jgi:hypothetical protein
MKDEELNLEEIEVSHTLGGWLRKKPMDLCACESEEDENGVGAGPNTTLMSDTL